MDFVVNVACAVGICYFFTYLGRERNDEKEWAAAVRVIAV